MQERERHFTGPHKDDSGYTNDDQYYLSPEKFIEKQRKWYNNQGILKRPSLRVEAEMSDLPSDELEWGKGVPTRENRGENHSCVNPDCEKSKYTWDPREIMDHMVGVKKAPFASGPNYEREYAFMIECPDCLHIWWHHGDKGYAQDMKIYKQLDDT